MRRRVPGEGAAHRVSFTCEPGEIFGLLGPKGAGKTTTLRMLSTVLQPTPGTAIDYRVRETAQASFPSRHWFRTPVRSVRYKLRNCPVFFFTEAEANYTDLSMSTPSDEYFVRMMESTW